MSDTCALIVTYNRPELLLRCLNSLFQQITRPDIIVIIDNGSSIHTQTKLIENGFLLYDTIDVDSEGNNTQINRTLKIPIRYVRFLQNRGPAYAFYFGVRLFQGTDFRWLWMMDDDGFADLNCLSALLKNISNADMLNPIVFDECDTEMLAFELSVEGTNEVIRNKDDVDRIAVNELIFSCAAPFNGTLISKNLIDAVGYPLHQMYGWGVEGEYLTRIYRYGLKVATVSTAYHFHPKSRVQKVTFFGGRYSVLFQTNRRLNYIYVRNNNYILFRNGGLYAVSKHLVLYTLYFIEQLKFRDWLLYILALIDGVFAFWGREKRFS